LQERISTGRLIDESKMNEGKAYLLSTVTIKNVKNKATMKYTLVPEEEANLKEGKISVESPIAKGLLGKQVGEFAEIKVPAGIVNFEIVNIEY
jgi:transcription elongation factor GreA